MCLALPNPPLSSPPLPLYLGVNGLEVRIMADALVNYFHHLLRRSLSDLVTRTNSVKGTMNQTQIQARTARTCVRDGQDLDCLAWSRNASFFIYRLPPLHSYQILIFVL